MTHYMKRTKWSVADVMKVLRRSRGTIYTLRTRETDPLPYERSELFPDNPKAPVTFDAAKVQEWAKRNGYQVYRR